VSASIAPIWLAKDLGIFEQYGFDVELITLQSSSQVAKVMASGEIPLAISAAAGVVDAVVAGDDQVLISGIQNYMNFWVHARPEITSIPQLRDKRVGATRIGSGAHLGVIEMLRRELAELAGERGVAVSVQGELGGTLPRYLRAPLFRLLRGAAVAVLGMEQPGRLAVTLQSDAEQIAAQLDAEGATAGEAQGRLDAYLGDPDVNRRIELLGGWGETERVDGRTTRLTVRAPLHGQV
jgi:hypothetical protein